MKLIKPHISEKTVKQAKEGHFTLCIDSGVTKGQVEHFLKKYYGLNAIGIRVINKRNLNRKAVKGYAKDRGLKKVIVSLGDKQKVPGFEIAFDTDKKDKTAKKS